MSTIVKTRIVKIGNSKGVRLPKILLDQTNLVDEIELEVMEGKIIIRTPKVPRQGWDEQFRSMAGNGDDKLLDEHVATDWDEEEWEW